MSALPIEDVFKKSGVQTHPFVRPLENEKLLDDLRTPRLYVIVEAPT